MPARGPPDTCIKTASGLAPGVSRGPPSAALRKPKGATDMTLKEMRQELDAFPAITARRTGCGDEIRVTARLWAIRDAYGLPERWQQIDKAERIAAYVDSPEEAIGQAQAMAQHLKLETAYRRAAA